VDVVFFCLVGKKRAGQLNSSPTSLHTHHAPHATNTFFPAQEKDMSSTLPPEARVRAPLGLPNPRGGNDCFPEHDTRVLTDAGFLFLFEIEARLSVGLEVKYACYEPSSKTVVYCPGELVTSTPPTRWVDFTQGGTRRIWEHGSEDYGVTKRSNGVYANHLSLRVTPGHDMFVQIGDDRGRPIFVQGAPLPPLKMKARELAPGYACDCNGMECVHGYTKYRMITTAAAGLATPMNVIALSDTDAQSPVAALGLCTEDELAAFLELFGYWLGDGSMTHDARPGQTSQNAVTFKPRKMRDRPYLRTLMHRLNLKCGQDYSSSETELYLGVQITNSRWFALFDHEFGVKYRKSRFYDSRLAFQKQGMTNCSEVEVMQAEDIGSDAVKSVKWLPSWVLFRLNKSQLRHLIEGIRFADGCSSATATQIGSQEAGGKAMCGNHRIYTSGIVFRDQLLQICIHAGYSAYFKINTRAGDIRGYNAVPKEDQIYTCEAMELAKLSDPSRQFQPIRGRFDNWSVCYSEQTEEILSAADVRFDGSASCVPVKKKKKWSRGWVAVHSDGTKHKVATQAQLGALLGCDKSSICDAAKNGHKVARVWSVYSSENYAKLPDATLGSPQEAAEPEDDQTTRNTQSAHRRECS